MQFLFHLSRHHFRSPILPQYKTIFSIWINTLMWKWGYCKHWYNFNIKYPHPTVLVANMVKVIDESKSLVYIICKYYLLSSTSPNHSHRGLISWKIRNNNSLIIDERVLSVFIVYLIIDLSRPKILMDWIYVLWAI